jgi:predicted RNase H-like HicB family nuclease
MRLPIPLRAMCKRRVVYTLAMRNEFTAVIERDGEWFIAWSPEVPGANGQGRTVEECRASLSEAIRLILADRREDGLRGVPPEAIQETVTVQ